MKDILERLFAWIQWPLPQHLLSRLAGYLARSELPWIRGPFIRAFIRVFGVDLSEAQRTSPEDYHSFNDFFTRALKPGARPLDEREDSILCPADGTVSALGSIRNGDLLQAKGHHYALRDLLGGDSTLAGEFSNGHFATIYLSPSDYHRVHMPFGGELRELIYVPGRLFSVNEATTRYTPNLFARNERCICVFDTPRGPAAVILVGAMLVAGIETVFTGQITPLPRALQRHTLSGPPSRNLEKGEELGRFLLGSTVIVLLPEGAAHWEETLGSGSKVRMGERMGALNLE